MRFEKLPYEDAELKVTALAEEDVIATSGNLTHVDGDEGSWV